MAEPSKRWHTREDSGIRLDRDLRWWHDDEPIEHPKIIEAFNTGLRPTEDGRFQLHLGSDWCFVQVEDAAYLVSRVEVFADGVHLWLSDRSEERLVPDTLTVDADGVFACLVKGGRAKARLSRDAQFSLGEQLEPGPKGWRLRWAGGSVELPRLQLPAEAEHR